MSIYMNQSPEGKGPETEKASADCLQRVVSRPREITPDDVTKEADRNYDLGRKHAREEITEMTLKPIVAAADPFIRIVAIADGLPPHLTTDDCPLARHIPGVWPTLGELRKLVAEIRKAANDQAQRRPDQDHE